MAARHRAPARRFVRNVNADELLERFLVSAVAAFLGLRIYLALTDYPQLGGHGLHIAHLLWGGLLMLIALVMTLAFLGARVRGWVAIIGGLGFGMFIDELGKFVTSDNNYFFRPTVALIYGIFVVLYLAFQAIGEGGATSPVASLARAVDAVEAGILGGFRDEDRERVLRLLDAADSADPLAQSLRDGVRRIEPLPDAQLGLLGRTASTLRGRYDRLIQERWLLGLVVVLLAIQVVTGLAGLVIEIVADPAFSLRQPSISLGDAIKGGADLIANGLIVVGVVRLPRSRLAAYRWFKRAVLVSLFLVQFYSFYESGLTAAWGLVFNLVLLAALNFAIGREQELATPPAEVSAEC